MSTYSPATRSFSLLSVAIAFFLASLLVANVLVVETARGRVFDDINSLPHRKVGLLLGTSNFTRAGFPNPVFSARMNAAARLYFAGKVDYILASGDNQSMAYNEPLRMKQALTDLGVPADRIVADYAGFSTLDSIVRAKDVFGQGEVTVVSQEFQNERAVFLGLYRDMDVVAFNARSASGYMALTLEFREWFARLKAVLDIFLFDTEPKFLGNRIEIE